MLIHGSFLQQWRFLFCFGQDIADVKLPEGDIKNNQVIGTFDNKDKAVDFCKKNSVAFEDITNHLQQRIEQKKQKANDKEQGSQPSDPDKKRNKGAGIDD